MLGFYFSTVIIYAICIWATIKIFGNQFKKNMLRITGKRTWKIKCWQIQRIVYFVGSPDNKTYYIAIYNRDCVNEWQNDWRNKRKG